MSYAIAADLQAHIYMRLTTGDGATALNGVPVYDVPPPASTDETFVLIGMDKTRSTRDSAGAQSRHQLVISVICKTSGFHQAKTIAGRVSDLLQAAPHGVLPSGTLLDLRFAQATARRIDNGAGRRIDLQFVAQADTETPTPTL
ncbi:DUF3168 domain-containing protein [Nereida sp. MMG025]|uniref:DUF3168 domain-containing protein n=1 Tax=Nereida sp. MMG025 TaxID=2909981 RepID=UPI001F36DF3E|nr:DUF3168 domain-containing protein [Nereida sp. MMG025]MCF6443487.1 DUF3168 domain-containing protein [Nereida sp. MMG025]